MIAPNEFAELTKPATDVRSTTAATRQAGEKPTGVRRRRSTAPVEPLRCWRIALRYALGEKVSAIAAAEDVTNGFVTQVAGHYHLPLRHRRYCAAAPRRHIDRLRELARAEAAELRAEALRWEAMAELE